MEIKTPDLGVESAEVSEILVSVGDTISENNNIVLLESDKAAVEVPSTASGTVSNILVSEGDTVSEGSVLIELEDSSSSEEQNTDEKGNDEKSNDEKSSDTDTEKSSNGTEQTQNDNDESNSNLKSESNSGSSSENNTESDNNELNQPSSKTYALPDLGVEEAEVAECLVNEGDEIDEDQPLILIESDKASVEVPSPVSGTVEKLLVTAGDKVENGQDYVVIKSNVKANQESSDSQNSTSDSQSTSVQSTSGQSTQANNSNNKESEKSDTNAKDANKGDAKKQDTSHETSENNIIEQPNQQNKLSESQVNKKLTEVYAGPAVRKMARQLGFDITQVEGSGPNKRIVKEDLFSYVKSHMQSKEKTKNGSATTSGLPNLPDMSKSEIWGDIETQDLSRLQKVSIPQLTYNTYLPQVTQFDLSDITETEKLRKELKPEFKNEGIGLTILAFIVKATAYALMQSPKFNSHLSDDNTQIYIRKTVNMGIAVATDDGLIVPVIKDAQQKGIKQIAIEIGELAEKARDKKLTTKELQGASFTISSQGNLGGTYFTPLVNWPQVGILGISEATMQPRWNAEQQSFEPRLMLPLSLSYDHRVINGADAAVFTRYIANLLADPRRILL